MSSPISLPPKDTEKLNSFYGLSWPLLIGLVACLGLLVLTSWQTSVDPDTYMHLTVGQWIWDHHTIPHEDFFSFTLPGRPWVAHEWLSELLFAMMYCYFGWTGLVFVLGLCLAVSLAVLIRFLLQRIPPIYAILFTALAYAGLSSHLLIRPHVLVWPILVLWVTRLVSAIEDHQDPPLYLLGLMTLWANLHGSFIFGLLITIPLALDAIISSPAKMRLKFVKTWGVFWILAVLASLISPLGIKGLLFPFQLMGLQHLDSIVEWMPSQFTRFNPLELILLVYLCLALLGFLSLSLVRALILVGLLQQALMHDRYASIFALIAPMLLAQSFGEHYANKMKLKPSSVDFFFARLSSKASKRSIVTAGAFLIVVAAILGQARHHEPSKLAFPVDAVDFAMKEGVTGPVLNSYDFGGYLISQKIPVFIDGRVDLYDKKILGPYINGVDKGDPKVLDSLVKEFNITWVLLRPNSLAMKYFDSNPQWKRIYQDDAAVIYVPVNFVYRDGHWQ